MRRRLQLLVLALLVLGAVPVSAVPTAVPAAAESGGVIKSICTFSHARNDDPIVFPGQPGASHRHSFFGSRVVDAGTTLAQLNASDTTCDIPEDRSGYWTPSLYVGGQLVEASHVAPYYTVRGADIRAVKAYPPGLKVLAGSATATAVQPTSVVSWSCDTGATGQRNTPPSCPNGDLRLKVQFPECWDGVRTDSPDHKSHMAYLSSNNARCPASHPVLVPSLALIYHYPTRGGTGTTLASGAHYTGHSDFFNAWEPAELQALITNCLVAGRLCHGAEFSVADAPTTEGRPAAFRVTMPETSAVPVEVGYATQADSATSPGDFTARSGRLTFPAGVRSLTLEVPTTQDGVGEATERFFLILSDPHGGRILDEKGLATVADDDAGPAASIGDGTIDEPGSGSRAVFLRVSLSAAAGAEVRVSWSTRDGSATAGGDYQRNSGTVRIAAGATSGTVQVRVNSDSANEGTEWFEVVITDVSVATVGDGAGRVTIT